MHILLINHIIIMQVLITGVIFLRFFKNNLPSNLLDSEGIYNKYKIRAFKDVCPSPELK